MPPNQLTCNLKKKKRHIFITIRPTPRIWMDRKSTAMSSLTNPGLPDWSLCGPKKNFFNFLENSSKSLATKKKFRAFLEKLATLEIWPFFGHSPYSLPNEWFGQVQNLFRLILLPHLQTKLENDHILTLHYFYFWQPWTVSFITISTINHFTIKTFLFDITEETL